MSARFAAATAVGDPASLAERCIAGLRATEGATIGFLYTTEPAAAVMPELVTALAEHTGIRSWVGGVGLGVCSGNAVIVDQPAAVVMASALPPASLRKSPGTNEPGSELPRRHSEWMD